MTSEVAIAEVATEATLSVQLDLSSVSNARNTIASGQKRALQDRLDQVVNRHIRERSSGEMALGFARYEALRRVSPRQYRELHNRNMKGENFDGMVDMLVLANNQSDSNRSLA